MDQLGRDLVEMFVFVESIQRLCYVFGPQIFGTRNAKLGFGLLHRRKCGVKDRRGRIRLAGQPGQTGGVILPPPALPTLLSL